MKSSAWMGLLAALLAGCGEGGSWPSNFTEAGTSSLVADDAFLRDAGVSPNGFRPCDGEYKGICVRRDLLAAGMGECPAEYSVTIKLDGVLKDGRLGQALQRAPLELTLGDVEFGLASELFSGVMGSYDESVIVSLEVAGEKTPRTLKTFSKSQRTAATVSLPVESLKGATGATALIRVTAKCVNLNGPQFVSLAMVLDRQGVVFRGGQAIRLSVRKIP